MDSLKPILVGCEESQILTTALRRAGFAAFSCDVEETRGNPDWHIKGDVVRVLQLRRWSLVVLHPPCTALALSGNRWYGRGQPRHAERLAALDWTARLWELAKRQADHVAMENPAGVLFPALGAPVCWVQPWQHGHGETKRTGFALHNLPPLVPTDPVPGREQRIWRMGPSSTRARDRSVTYPGIARAIVQQWAGNTDRS